MLIAYSSMFAFQCYNYFTTIIFAEYFYIINHNSIRVFREIRPRVHICNFRGGRETSRETIGTESILSVERLISVACIAA